MANGKRRKNAAAVALGSLGGRARARKLSQRRLQEISALGNAMRWAKAKPRKALGK
jgi:hypothetical protein